jgi:RNA polymerase sigma-70 factor (ECF subfamily)
LGALKKEARGGDDERRLVEAAKADPRRFGELYEENFGRVYAYIARRVRDRAAAEDVTADVFHHALKNLARFEWQGTPFVAWLYRIAANMMADRWQRVAREAGTPAPEVPDEKAAEEIERRAMLFRLVDSLPEDQRRVVLARFAEQKKISEIAREMGRSEGAVKQLQFRALEALRAKVGGANG